MKRREIENKRGKTIQRYVFFFDENHSYLLHFSVVFEEFNVY